MHGIQIPSIQYCANLSLLIVLVPEVFIFIVSDDSPRMKQICNTVLINVKLLYNLLFNPTPVGGGVFRPPTEKWQLLLKIMILMSPNFVTFHIYL